MTELSNTHSSFADLTGRHAVVTGASSGIGRAIALELARAGADLVLHCRQSRSALEGVAAEARRIGRAVELALADFSLPESCHSWIDDVFRLQPRADLIVLNAGADILTTATRSENYATRLQVLLDIDVRSTLLLAHEIGQRLQRSKVPGASILTIGWDQADRGMEGESGELFAASKNAVMGFTRSLAVSLSPSVRVNCIAPGWIRTAWGETASEAWQERVRRETPLQRWGAPEDIARTARFLLSDEASYITGQVINVNGGAVR